MPEQEELLARIEALEKIKHRPFSTWFEWAVLVSVVALLALQIIMTNRLEKADRDIVSEIGQDMTHVTEVVDNLWEIWGK